MSFFSVLLYTFEVQQGCTINQPEMTGAGEDNRSSSIFDIPAVRQDENTGISTATSLFAQLSNSALASWY
jgi:hypothetical protein